MDSPDCVVRTLDIFTEQPKPTARAYSLRCRSTSIANDSSQFSSRAAATATEGNEPGRGNAPAPPRSIIIEAIDIDGDGRMTIEEFLRAVAAGALDLSVIEAVFSAVTSGGGGAADIERIVEYEWEIDPSEVRSPKE
jgi:hypothetical protein